MADLARYSGSSWLDKIRSARHARSSIMNTGIEAGYAIRQLGEGTAVAAVLGLLVAKRGPTVQLSATTPAIPVDLALGLIGVAGGLFLADSDVSHDLRNIGTAGVTIYTYRTVQKLINPSGTVVAGEPVMGAEDPVIAAARLLT
jgi:hypothetical protein